MAKVKKEVTESKNAKNARKKVDVVKKSPICCGENTLLARMYTETGSIIGMKYYCMKCQSTF